MHVVAKFEDVITDPGCTYGEPWILSWYQSPFKNVSTSGKSHRPPTPPHAKTIPSGPLITWYPSLVIAATGSHDGSHNDDLHGDRESFCFSRTPRKTMFTYNEMEILSKSQLNHPWPYWWSCCHDNLASNKNVWSISGHTLIKITLTGYTHIDKKHHIRQTNIDASDS